MNRPLASGTILGAGKYRIDDLLKIGGQSIVYTGIEIDSDQLVVVKQNYENEKWSRDVLRQEATLLKSLQHHSLPRAIECFDENGSTFLVLSYIPGNDLEELLRRRGGPFPYHDVLGWAYQLLDILDHLQAQEPEIVHRDINPKNIKITHDNQVFLLDFGIAKRKDLKTFLIGGTRRFAPPEQLKDEGTDRRTDIYALAATLYYLLTGTQPNDALSRESAVLKGQADPLRAAQELNAEIPTFFSQVLTKALSLEAKYRPNSAAAMKQWLTSEFQEICFQESSVNNKVESELTQVAVRDSFRVVIPLASARCEDITTEANGLMRLLEGGHELNPGIIQTLIEMIDSQVEQRQKVLASRSTLINKDLEDESNIAIILIRKMAANAYIERTIENRLRQRLGQLLADHALSAVTELTNRPNPPKNNNNNLFLSAGTLRQYMTQRRWLRRFAIWLVRGCFAGLVIQLFLSFFRGGQSAIDLLSVSGTGVWIAHILLIGLGFVMARAIRKMKYANQKTNEEPSLAWRFAGLGFGLLFSVILFHNVLWTLGLN